MFRGYLERRHFILYTDHGALKWLNGTKDSPANFGRRALPLKTFDFKVVSIPGKDNEAVDSLAETPKDKAQSERHGND